MSDTQTQSPVDQDVASHAATDTASAEINRLKADIVITRHMAIAAGAGLIPLPMVDFAAVTGVQLSMLALICEIYDQPFSKQAATSLVASLAGGAVIGGEASSLAISSRLKFIPVIGTIASWFVTPTLAAATTYAIGKVFVHHLETGGTLLTFEAKKLKEYMDKAMAEGKKMVPRWGKGATTEAPEPAPSV